MIGASKSGKNDPPFCTMTRFFDFQVPLSPARISFLSVSLCLRKRVFSESLNFTTPCKTVNTHSHTHLTSGLSAVRAIATLWLLSPWQRAFKRTRFLFEKCLPHGAALRPIDAVVFFRLINTRFIQRDLKYLGTYATWAPSLGNIYARNLNSSKQAWERSIKGRSEFHALGLDRPRVLYLRSVAWVFEQYQILGIQTNVALCLTFVKYVWVTNITLILLWWLPLVNKSKITSLDGSRMRSSRMSNFLFSLSLE